MCSCNYNAAVAAEDAKADREPGYSGSAGTIHRRYVRCPGGPQRVDLPGTPGAAGKAHG